MTTLRVPFYLVANKKLGDNIVASLAKAMMELRRDLLGEYPIFAQIGAPSLEKDAHIPIHPGAALYFNGEQQTFLDRYADKLFYLVMLLGLMASMLAATWKFMTRDADPSRDHLLMGLNELAGRVQAAGTELELMEAERCIDEILELELERYMGVSSIVVGNLRHSCFSPWYREAARGVVKQRYRLVPQSREGDRGGRLSPFATAPARGGDAA
ncbi:hypothetical protein [Bradyrhizobium australiense]|uniref:TRAP transporter solute receptor, TAXI family n=1 Tax=Bradyrhizobium australiense TaxID=2721161 RepID=A0A7Y4GQU6_9BRAD|nr:hypothetical protein [Bradyrhizobium australiense]NOJ40284.1 hypothetical protein [Bradyrhizobium australiense]